MTTLMVWDYQADHNSEEGYTWKKVPTQYKVGSHQELLFWRVMDTVNGASSKDYFYSPREYEVFSGISMDEYKDKVACWAEQYNAASKKLNITSTNTNATIISNGGSYASFFSIDTVQPTESTVS